MVMIFQNGQLIEKQHAVVSIDDRGFRFGDGIFETIRIDHSIPYQWDEHFARLKRGLEAILLRVDKKILEGLKINATALIRQNQAKKGFLRIMITRGIGSVGYLPASSISPTIIMEIFPERPIPIHDITIGVATLKQPSLRSFPVQHKTMQGLHSTLVKLEASQYQYFDNVILNEKDEICEMSSGNIFWLRNEVLYTPSENLELIPGIIRKRVIALSPWKVVEGRFKLQDLEDADAVMLTNVSWLVIPVNRLMPQCREWNNHLQVLHLRTLIDEDIARECQGDTNY